MVGFHIGRGERKRKEKRKKKEQMWDGGLITARSRYFESIKSRFKSPLEFQLHNFITGKQDTIKVMNPTIISSMCRKISQERIAEDVLSQATPEYFKHPLWASHTDKEVGRKKKKLKRRIFKYLFCWSTMKELHEICVCAR